MTIRRFEVVESAGGPLVTYLHPGDKIGVVIAMESGDVAIARDLAMHIAAMSPRFLDAKAVSADAIDSERKIIEAIVDQETRAAKAESNKPAGAPSEMVDRKPNGDIDGFVHQQEKSGDEPYRKRQEN